MNAKPLPTRNWPFPLKPLDYPCLPPALRPVRAAPQRKRDVQDLPPALF